MLFLDFISFIYFIINIKLLLNTFNDEFIKSLFQYYHILNYCKNNSPNHDISFYRYNLLINNDKYEKMTSINKNTKIKATIKNRELKILTFMYEYIHEHIKYLYENVHKIMDTFNNIEWINSCFDTLNGIIQKTKKMSSNIVYNRSWKIRKRRKYD